MPFDDRLQGFLNRQTPIEPERQSAKPIPAHSAPSRDRTHEGRVIRYDVERRYGFIAQSGDGADVFVPERELRKSGLPSLTRGDRVRFDIEPDKRGGRPIATNLKLAG